MSEEEKEREEAIKKLRQLFSGTTLDPYIEAARTLNLTEFLEALEEARKAVMKFRVEIRTVEGWTPYREYERKEEAEAVKKLLEAKGAEVKVVEAV